MSSPTVASNSSSGSDPSPFTLSAGDQQPEGGSGSSGPVVLRADNATFDRLQALSKELEEKISGVVTTHLDGLLGQAAHIAAVRAQFASVTARVAELKTAMHKVGTVFFFCTREEKNERQ